MADEKRTLDDAFRELASLRAALNDANRTITKMQAVGGFADSKTLSIRCGRIEDRLSLVELDGEMLKDTAALNVEQMAAHLVERHQAPERDNTPDAIFIRKIRRRMLEWLEKRGLLNKRSDVTGARNDENRLRPRAATS